MILSGEGAAGAGATVATSATAQSRTDVEPRVLDGQPVPEPGPDKSAGPVRPRRGTSLSGRLRWLQVQHEVSAALSRLKMAANGADVVAVDIAGPVSTASYAVPATPEELNETVRQMRDYERGGEAVSAEIRDIAALRSVADHVEREYGKIDVVVADAAMHNAGTQRPCLPVRATAGRTPRSPGSAAHLQ